MKRLIKICGHRLSNMNVEDRQPLVPHSGQPLEPPSQQHMDYGLESTAEAHSEPDSRLYSSDPNHEIFCVTKRNNAFSVAGARFLPDGELHSVVISFDRGRETKMKLVIDEETVRVVDTKWQLRGNLELNIDGMVVDFLWDLIRQPVKFSFSTRAVSFAERVVGSSSGGNENDDGEFDSDAEQWEDYEEIHVLEIMEAEQFNVL